MSACILLVEDDPVIRTFLADNLTADGYDLLVASTQLDALRLLETGEADIVIVDVGLPDGSGLDLIRRIRASDGVASRIDPELPVVVLSGCASELDRVRGFERGADDYVAKPFAFTELRMRIAAILRRGRARTVQGVMHIGALRIDPAARSATVSGRRVELAAKEFALLRALASEPTRVFTKEELLRDVWGYRAVGQTRTLDSHACRLRQKLRTDDGEFVVNVWGVGYRLIDGSLHQEKEPWMRDPAA
jgi:DNA-binding response OmpR family regulator